MTKDIIWVNLENPQPRGRHRDRGPQPADAGLHREPARGDPAFDAEAAARATPTSPAGTSSAHDPQPPVGQGRRGRRGARGDPAARRRDRSGRPRPSAHDARRRPHDNGRRADDRALDHRARLGVHDHHDAREDERPRQAPGRRGWRRPRAGLEGACRGLPLPRERHRAGERPARRQRPAHAPQRHPAAPARPRRRVGAASWRQPVPAAMPRGASRRVTSAAAVAAQHRVDRARTRVRAFALEGYLSGTEQRPSALVVAVTGGDTSTGESDNDNTLRLTTARRRRRRAEGVDRGARRRGGARRPRAPAPGGGHGHPRSAWRTPMPRWHGAWPPWRPAWWAPPRTLTGCGPWRGAASTCSTAAASA